MPDTETDVGFSDETLADFEYGENAEKNEGEPVNTYEVETNASANTISTPENTTALAAILEERGGKAEDWQFIDRGNGGYQFDGENIRDPEGEIWTNPDAALHEAMLAEWREGESGIFLLPDHTERDEDKETLYITTLHLDGASGSVSWEIHAFETPIVTREESETRAENNREVESFAVRWEEIESEIELEQEKPEIALGALAAAEKAVEETVAQEISNTDNEELNRTIETKRDTELNTLLNRILSVEPLDITSLEDDVEKEIFAKADEESAVERTLPVAEKETPAEIVLHALGIPLPTQKRNEFRAKVPGFRPTAGKKLVAPPIIKTRTGETKLNGIRMRKAA